MKPEEFEKYKPIRYGDWFGDRDSHEDYQQVISVYGKPKEVWVTYDASREFSERSSNVVMTLLVYDDKIVVVGYDGNEYHHHFEFKRFFE